MDSHMEEIWLNVSVRNIYIYLYLYFIFIDNLYYKYSKQVRF